jgi:hypothetical protein
MRIILLLLIILPILTKINYVGGIIKNKTLERTEVYKDKNITFFYQLNTGFGSYVLYNITNLKQGEFSINFFMRLENLNSFFQIQLYENSKTLFSLQFEIVDFPGGIELKSNLFPAIEIKVETLKVRHVRIQYYKKTLTISFDDKEQDHFVLKEDLDIHYNPQSKFTLGIVKKNVK